MPEPLLNWRVVDNYQEATLGTAADGVTFCLSRHPTCYRRGPWRLLVEVHGGPAHELWGCFDAADQPMRWFHREANAKDEAECITAVLMKDRQSRTPKMGELAHA